MENLAREEANERRQSERQVKRRLIFIWGVMALIFGVIGYHVYVLQTEEADEHLRARSERQSQGSMTLGAGGESELDGHRGYIYDRHGYELAISVETPSIFAHPAKVVDKEETALALSRALDMDLGQIRRLLSSDAPFVWIARKTTPEKGAAVKALKLSGIGMKRESKRYYPGQELAGQILGFVGIDNVGLEGLEATYDKYLRAGVLRIRGMRDSRNHMILTSDSPRLNSLEGGSVVLTLDQHIQKISENALDRVCRKFSAKAGLAVVMDPFTGEVLAMANWPRFNPNRFKDYQKEDMRNRVVLDAYEPGSMMKLITYASAVEGAGVRPNDPVDQNHGKIKIGAHTISDTHAIPNMVAETVVSESSNIGAYHLAQKLGQTGFYEYLHKFGFGQRTGIRIAGESAGILTNPSRRKWAEVQYANIAFGHGISVSPLQMAVAVSAIANGGERVRPWLIKEIRNQEGVIIEEGAPEKLGRVISKKTAKTVRHAMERVVAEGTGMRAYVEGYRVGGKTGTAQKIDPRTRAYGHQYMANFIGIAPIDEPDVVVVVMIDAPKPQHSGGFVAAPVFAEIVTQILPYRGIFPKTVNDGVVDPFDISGVRETAKLLRERDRTPYRLTNARPCEVGMVKVPDLTGKAAMTALAIAKDNCLNIRLQSSGYIVSQWPSAGTEVSTHTRVDVTLKPPYR